MQHQAQVSWPYLVGWGVIRVVLTEERIGIQGKRWGLQFDIL